MGMDKSLICFDDSSKKTDPYGELKIFAGSSGKQLGRAICARLGMDLARSDLRLEGHPPAGAGRHGSRGVRSGRRPVRERRSPRSQPAAGGTESEWDSCVGPFVGAVPIEATARRRREHLLAL